MRKYIRHPADIPIEVQLRDASGDATASLANNVSLGGLSFNCHSPIPVGQSISIKVPLVDPSFETSAEVVWCKPLNDQYEIGVKLLDQDDAYRTRMVEQICHIEHYKNQVLLREGRVLTGQQAAQEWIQKYGNTFPNIHEVESL